MRRFSVGEVVTWIPDLLLRSESHGVYRIVAAMPDREGDHMYRIKSPLEEYERVVKEDLRLIRRARSEGPAVRLPSSPPLFGGALEPMQSLKRTACPCDGTATNNKC